MGRGRKIALGVLIVLIAAIAINAFLVDRETQPAAATIPDGRILQLPGGDVQIIDRGRPGSDPIVLIHCFTCAIDWWDRMLPPLERRHRVVALDLLGHGGSEKPGSGYSMPDQAEVVAQALRKLGVREATVAGHSLGGSIAVALAEQAPDLVRRIAIIDEPSGPNEGDLGFLASLAFAPVIGEAFWSIKTDFTVRQGLEIAFAPGFDVPDTFVQDLNRMTFTAYDESPAGFLDYTEERPLATRLREIGKPLLVIMGAEEQLINDPVQALAEYIGAVPSARTELIEGAGHSPNVEKPGETARILLSFAADARPQDEAIARK